MATQFQDVKYLAAVRQGDFEAFEHLYSLYHARVYSFVYRLCWDADQAEQLLQDTFLRLWKGAKLISRDAQILPQLYRMAKDAWLEAVRENPCVSNPDAPACAVKPSRSTRKRMRDEHERALKESLLALEPKPRVIAVLVLHQGLSLKDAAEVMGHPQAALETVLAQSEAQLRQALQSRLSENDAA